MILDLEELRQLYDIHTVLGLTSRKKWLVCPLPQHSHSNHTPSFSIYRANDGVQRFKCHGNCGLQGDVIDLIGYLEVPGYNPTDGKKVQQAAMRLRGERDIVVPTPETIQKPVELHPMRWRKYLPIGKEARVYAHERGLSDKTIHHFKLGQDRKRWLTIPAFQEGKLMGVKKRNLTTNGPRYTNDGGSRQTLFNWDEVAWAVDQIFVVKAEIPAMLLWQMGYKVCAPTGGEEGWEDKWSIALAMADVVVIGDNDEVGVRAASRRAMDLGGTVKFPPKEFKDVDEWILARPDEAEQTLEQWSRR